MLQTTIIVPCYNEAARLDREAFLQGVGNRPWLRLLLVDDGSTDETIDVLRQLHERAPDQIDVLALEHNSGKAEAVRQGVLAAFERDGDVIGFLDADLATPFDEVGPMVEALEQKQLLMVMASRVALLGRDVQRDLKRHYIGRVFATIASVAVGLPVYDTQCGAKVFRKEPVFQEVFSEPFHSRWAFDVEILERLVRYDRRHGTTFASGRVAEFPLSQWHDIEGSKVKPVDGIKAVFELLGVAVRLRKA